MNEIAYPLHSMERVAIKYRIFHKRASTEEALLSYLADFRISPNILVLSIERCEF